MRAAVLLLLVAALVALAAVPAAASPLLVIDEDGRASVREDPHLPPAETVALPRPGGSTARAAQSPAPRDDADRAPRRPRGPSVRRALLTALRTAQIDQAAHDRYRGRYDEALAARGRLQGARRAELGSVISTLERIAAANLLSPSRMRPLFLQLERNTTFWTTRPFPAPGTRIAFSSSPIIFQYYAGRGLQIQPLANFARANSLFNACDGQNTGEEVPCRRRALRDLLDALVGIAVQRGSFLAWEYYFSFGGGQPPWISGLSQGTAVQALARGAETLDAPGYLEVARAALGAFETPAPVGVLLPADGGNHYLIYSFNRRLLVLNGFLQAVVGLYDFAELTDDVRARGLFEAGERAARVAVPAYDTGAWSLYSLGGEESDLGYHRLVRDFLLALCDRVQEDVYCGTAERFTRYLLERPRVQLLRSPASRTGRPATVRYRLSKRSRVAVRVTLAGRPVLARTSSERFGLRSFSFTPRRPGRYRIRVEAVDLRNHHTVRRGSVLVTGRAR